MTLIDTHTHLYSEAFKEDLPEVIARAIEKDVTEFYLPAIDSSHIASMEAVKKSYPDQVYLMAGLHPTSVKGNYEQELEIVEKELATREYVAVGEIGMDLYWDKTFLKEQQVAFARQIELSLTHDLPIAIHCRDAFDDVFEVLEDYKGKNLTGVFHCFTGTQAQANLAVDLGLHLGIGGVVTFKNGKIDQFLSQIPLDKIVLETDSPYLAPTPYRGKRNESSYIRIIADRVADIYSIPLEEVARTTTQTARHIFHKVKR